MLTFRNTLMLALAGSAVAMPATLCRAQDSVSNTNGLPGDASPAYQIASGDSRQILRFVVDLRQVSNTAIKLPR